MTSLVTAATQRAVAPRVSNFDVLVNRYATARFDMEILLQDYRRVLEATRRSIKYPAALAACLMEKLIAGIDARMTQRIIANPQRLNFGHGVLWNSFVSALERAEHFELPHSH